VERLILDADLRERIGREGFADTTGKYTWRALAETVDRVYSRLLEDNRSR